jgi:flagellar assembly protein FliH
LERALEECGAAKERALELERSIEPLKREAWDQGFRAAHAAAQETAQRETDAERRRCAEAIAYMAQLRSEWRREIESGAVALALAVARRIIGRELSIDSGAVQAIVRIAMEKAQGQELQRVRVCPAAAQSVRACLAAEAPGVELVPDPELRSGDVRFELAQGALDASVDAQLEEIERGFADAARQ